MQHIKLITLPVVSLMSIIFAPPLYSMESLRAFTWLVNQYNQQPSGTVAQRHPQKVIVQRYPNSIKKIDVCIGNGLLTITHEPHPEHPKDIVIALRKPAEPGLLFEDLQGNHLKLAASWTAERFELTLHVPGQLEKLRAAGYRHSLIDIKGIKSTQIAWTAFDGAIVLLNGFRREEKVMPAPVIRKKSIQNKKLLNSAEWSWEKP